MQQKRYSSLRSSTLIFRPRGSRYGTLPKPNCLCWYSSDRGSPRGSPACHFRFLGVPRFVLLGRPSDQRALLRVRCGVLCDSLFGSPSVLHGVSSVPVGGRSVGIAASPDDSLVASFYGACFPP
jgi:hypothetical protein